MRLPDVILIPLQPDDREQFILDNQWAFKYGAQQEFGMRDDRCEEGEEVISRSTIEHSIDGETAETPRRKYWHSTSNTSAGRPSGKNEHMEVSRNLVNFIQ